MRNSGGREEKFSKIVFHDIDRRNFFLKNGWGDNIYFC